MEIERKWVIDEKNTTIPFDDGIRNMDFIEQAYFLNDNKMEGRVRKKIHYEPFGSCPSKIESYITFKSSNKQLVREEAECKVTDEVADFLFNKIGKSLKKFRYTGIYNGCKVEYDRYIDKFEGLKIIEIEFNNEEESNHFIPPTEWIEVTGDEQYYNSNLFQRLVEEEKTIRITL